MAVSVADEQDRPVDHDDLVALAEHVLDERGVPDDIDVGLLLVDEATIADLNRQHLDRSGPTDVLAFPLDQPGEGPEGVPAILGDVVLCPEVAAVQARDAGTDPGQELRMLTVHGILHLLGMDHAEPEEEREMFTLTERLLGSYRRSA